MKVGTLMQYIGLRYTGLGRGSVIDIYPTNKRVEIQKNHPYMFTKEDVINQTSINYYRSLKKILHIELIKGTATTPTVPSSTPSEPENNSESIIDPESKIPSEDNPSEESTEDDEISDNNTLNNEQLPPAEDLGVTDAEIYEFLDMNYDDTTIKQLADEIGVKYRSNNTKSSVIDKIVSENKEYVANLIKLSSK